MNTREDLLEAFDFFYGILAHIQAEGMPLDNEAADEFMDDIKTRMAQKLESFGLDNMDLG